MKKTLIISLVLIATAFTLANGAEHGTHEEAGIPFEWIGLQALNLGILLAALIYFIRKPLIDFFAKRQAQFNEQSQKTAAALKLAESELKEIKEKLASLESTAAASVQKAQSEAEITKTKIVQEALTLAEKMKKDVALIVSAELYKAKNEIRAQIIEKSISTAKESLRDSAQTITEKSEKGFISDLGRVQA